MPPCTSGDSVSGTAHNWRFCQAVPHFRRFCHAKPRTSRQRRPNLKKPGRLFQKCVEIGPFGRAQLENPSKNGRKTKHFWRFHPRFFENGRISPKVRGFTPSRAVSWHQRRALGGLFRQKPACRGPLARSERSHSGDFCQIEKLAAHIAAMGPLSPISTVHLAGFSAREIEKLVPWRESVPRKNEYGAKTCQVIAE